MHRVSPTISPWVSNRLLPVDFSCGSFYSFDGVCISHRRAGSVDRGNSIAFRHSHSLVHFVAVQSIVPISTASMSSNPEFFAIFARVADVLVQFEQLIAFCGHKVSWLASLISFRVSPQARTNTQQRSRLAQASCPSPAMLVSCSLSPCHVSPSYPDVGVVWMVQRNSRFVD